MVCRPFEPRRLWEDHVLVVWLLDELDAADAAVGKERMKRPS